MRKHREFVRILSNNRRGDFLANNNAHTTIGLGALFLWVIEPLVVSELEGFPIFESLTIVFASCFLLTALRITLAKRWGAVLRQPVLAWIFGVAGICGSDFCYVLAAYTAPIAQVDLIDYLWPCIFVLFIGFIPSQKFSWKYVIGSIFGLLGVMQLIHGDGVLGVNPNYALGYLLAIYGVVIWGIYSVFSCHHKDVPTDMIGVYCGVGAVITFCLHLNLETTVVPSLKQGGMALTLGLAGPGLAYQLWDHGIKFGNAKLLSVLCYLARIMAMGLLVWFGKEPFSDSLVTACVLTILGVVICTIDDSWLKAFTENFKLKVFNRKMLLPQTD